MDATTLPDGTYTVQVQQTDAAGNTGTSTAVTFTVDASAPSVTGIVVSDTLITDADAGLRVDRAILQSTNMVWGGAFGDVQALIARMLESLRRDRAMDANEVAAASSVLLECAGYRLSSGDLFRETVAATAPWLQRPELAPLALANWLITYAPLGRRWPTPGVQLPAANPVACLELAVELARTHGGRSVAFSGSKLSSTELESSLSTGFDAAMPPPFGPAERVTRAITSSRTNSYIRAMSASVIAK